MLENYRFCWKTTGFVGFLPRWSLQTAREEREWQCLELAGCVLHAHTRPFQKTGLLPAFSSANAPDGRSHASVSFENVSKIAWAAIAD